MVFKSAWRSLIRWPPASTLQFLQRRFHTLTSNYSIFPFLPLFPCLLESFLEYIFGLVLALLTTIVIHFLLSSSLFYCLLDAGPASHRFSGRKWRHTGRSVYHLGHLEPALCPARAFYRSCRRKFGLPGRLTLCSLSPILRLGRQIPVLPGIPASGARKTTTDCCRLALQSLAGSWCRTSIFPARLRMPAASGTNVLLRGAMSKTGTWRSGACLRRSISR